MIKETLSHLKKFYRMVHMDYPLTLFYVTMSGIFEAILPFISLYFSNQILDALLNSQIEEAKKYIFILLVSTFVVGVVGKFFYRMVNFTSWASHFAVPKQTAYKAFKIQYEKFEEPKTMEEIRSASNSMNGSGGISGQIEDTSHFVRYACSVIFSLGFVVSLLMKTIHSSRFIFHTFLLLIALSIFLWSGFRIHKKRAKMDEHYYRNNDDVNRLFSYLSDVSIDVQNGKDIRLFKMNHLIQYWWNQMLGNVKENYEDHGTRTGINAAQLAFASQLFACCVYIYVGASVIDGAISIGNVLLYTGAITRFTTDLSGAINEFAMISYRFGYLNKFETFISSKDMSYDGTLPIEKRNDGQYLLEFRNVSFKYPNTDQYVLKNINLTFDLYQRLAIVGQNGAGKTTLIKLLCRLYEPSEGEILLNGINISKYDYEEYTNIFSVVFQDFRLFPLPLDQNIAGSERVNEAKVLECIENVGLKETVQAWPQQEKTYLYKNLGDGMNVSGGEAQKIAIARALYKDAPFIIMDEPTAALDPLSEAEIYENFNELVKGKTSIFISHRMSSCKFCDDILVLENGEIIERGNHQFLLDHQGLYRKLWDAQAQYYVETS